MKYLSKLIFTFVNAFALIPIAYANIEFVIIVPSYNNQLFYIKNLDSIVNQKTQSPYEIIYINDCSTDQTGQLVEEYIKEHKLLSLIKVIHNKTKVGQLENVYNAVHSCPDYKIIVIVDGDDFLAHDHVLARLEREYQNPQIWLTYGQYECYPSGEKGGCGPFPKHILKSNKFRKHQWVTSHLRTFKAALFKKIRKQDLLYKQKFFPMCTDLATMFPMLEMASKGHIKFIPDILYLYNTENPLSCHRKNTSLQMYLTKLIRAKKPYKPQDYLKCSNTL